MPSASSPATGATARRSERTTDGTNRLPTPTPKGTHEPKQRRRIRVACKVSPEERSHTDPSEGIEDEGDCQKQMRCLWHSPRRQHFGEHPEDGATLLLGRWLGGGFLLCCKSRIECEIATGLSAELSRSALRWRSVSPSIV